MLSDGTEMDSSIGRHVRSRWSMLGIGCVALAAIVFVAMYLAIGPGNLPPQVAEQVREKPWVFGLFTLIGSAIAITGMRGVITRRAVNVVQGSLAPSEFSGTTAVLVGLGQCLAGALAVGACLYVLLVG